MSMQEKRGLSDIPSREESFISSAIRSFQVPPSYKSNQVFSFFSHFDKIRPKIRVMEPLEYFSDLFSNIGTPNFLMIGVVVLILWLLISGIRKGLRKGGREKERSEKNGED